MLVKLYNSKSTIDRQTRKGKKDGKTNDIDIVYSIIKLFKSKNFQLLYKSN